MDLVQTCAGSIDAASEDLVQTLEVSMDAASEDLVQTCMGSDLHGLCARCLSLCELKRDFTMLI